MAVIRFDSKALFAALDKQRKKSGMTWKQVAAEMGIAVSTITRTSKGGRMEVDGMLAMLNWLGVPVETYIQRNP